MILHTFLPLLLCLLIVRLPAPPLYHHSLPPGPVSCVRLRTVPYKNAAGYIQHLSSRHHGEGPFTLRISGSLNSVLMLKASRHIESARTRNLRFSGLPANPPLSQLQTPPLRRSLKRAKTFRKSSCLTSSSVLCTTFTAPGVPPYSVSSAVSPRAYLRDHRRWKRSVHLPGLVVECNFGKWIPVGDLLAHLVRGIELMRSDQDYGGLVLAQAQAVVTRAAKQRNTAPVLDHSAVASLQRQIERLLRERRLRLVANKLINQFHLTLQPGSIAPAKALTLDEVRAQSTQLFPSAGDRDTFSNAHIQLAQKTDPSGYIASILRSLNRSSGSGVSGWTDAFILDVFTSDTGTRDIGVNLLIDLCNKMLAGQMQSPLWLLSRLVLISKPADCPFAPFAPGANPQ